MALEKYTRVLVASGVKRALVIRPSSVVTSHWVRLKCQYGCSGYGRKLTCPPYSPTPEQTRKLLDEYKRAILIVYSGQWRGADQRTPGRERKKRRQMRRVIVEMERVLFLDGYYRAFALGAGPCNFCRECDVSKACKFPELARPAMEACGIDVFATLRKAGLTIDVVRNYHAPCTFASLLLVD